MAGVGYRATQVTASASVCGAPDRTNKSSTTACESLGGSTAAATTMLGLPVLTAPANLDAACPGGTRMGTSTEAGRVR